MNIKGAVAESLYKIRGEKAHVAREADQINLMLMKRRDYFTVMLKARASTTLDCEDGESALLREPQARRIRVVTDDDGDTAFGNAPLGDGIRQRQHVRAATRNQNADAMRH